MFIHIIKKGDTIGKIAYQYGVSPQRILEDNGLLNANDLVIGQALIILIPEIIYTVKPSDTLTNIAAQYNTTIMALIQNNPSLITNQTLFIGQQLVISYKWEKARNIITNGYAYPNIDKEVLMKALPYLTMVTIFGYGFTESGELITIDDQPIIDLALQFKVAPIMLLSSISETGKFSSERASYLFGNVKAQDALINKIIAKMKEKRYYGLDVDFEYIKPEDREGYLNFLRNITEKLNAEGFIVNVDLAPKISATQKGLLYEGHDYAQIGAIANTVLIMTYEWGYTYGPPMTVAPLNNVRQVVNYAVSEIPNYKILMGIPNYGYDWTLPYERGTSKATSVGNEQAIQLAAQYGVEIQFDDTAQSPYFNYFSSDKKEHVVWFEDVRSIMAKFNLITEYTLLGASYWNIMRPFSQNWALLNTMFQITKFIN